MGNTCVGPSLGANGFLQTVTAAVWRTRPPEDRLPPPPPPPPPPTNSSEPVPEPEPKTAAAVADTPKTAEPPMRVQSTPPEPVKIDNEPEPEPEKEKEKEIEIEKEKEKPVDKPAEAEAAAVAPAMVPVVTAPALAPVVAPASEVREEEVPAKPKKPTHIKRVSSAGLQMDSVLGRKTENLKERYTLGRKLGQGQFGITFLCLEKGTNDEFACKSIAKRKLTSEEDVEDVRREIQIMHHLAGHPNVIQILGAYEDAVAVHVVMELCAGGELFDRIIQKGHYTERKAAELARIIVGVVEACHSLGVMHRDLKPENFLFVNQEEDSPLKTIDFGLSVFFRPGMCTFYSL